MSELDKILDAVMKSKMELIQREAPSEERDELITALREKKKQDIVDEIRAQYKEELLQEVNIETAREINRQKIEDLKSLMWSGFLLAFVVGLAVNQATDLIGYYKGTVMVDEIWPTVMITCGLCLICIGAYVYSFWKNAVSLFDDFKKNKKQEK